MDRAEIKFPDIQDNKIEHIIYDMGSLIPNGKSLGRLRLKKQYLGVQDNDDFDQAL